MVQIIHSNETKSWCQPNADTSFGSGEIFLAKRLKIQDRLQDVS
jgi:hypothetical protein